MQMLGGQPGLHTSYTTITRPLAECAIKVCASNQVECVIKLHASNQGATFQTKKAKAVKAQNPEVLQHHQHLFSGTPIPGSMKIPWSPAGSWTHTEENRENRLLSVKRGAGQASWIWLKQFGWNGDFPVGKPYHSQRHDHFIPWMLGISKLFKVSFVLW